MSHTRLCDTNPVLETVIAPAFGDQVLPATPPVVADEIQIQCPRSRCLMVEHITANAIWIALTYPGVQTTRRVFLAVRPGITRVLLTEEITSVFKAGGVDVVVWTEDLPAAARPGEAP